MTKVLFICHGNICRSPMAEFIFKKMIGEKGLDAEFEVSSAATSREELYNDMYPPAKRCLDAHGVEYSPRHARQIDKSDLEYYDYIVAMEEYNIRNLNRLLGPSKKYSLLLDYTGSAGDIDDPWYSGDFETCYKEIVEGCKALLEALK